jgi:hypothetical protein
MTVTMDQVQRTLGAEEPNYAAAARLGTDALPHLELLAAGPDAGLAAKAVSLAALIDHGASATRVVTKAAASQDPVVRVAAAAALSNLRTMPLAVATRLLVDADVGVRKLTLRSVAAAGANNAPELAASLRAISTTDPAPDLRRAASALLAGDTPRAD